MVDASRLSRVGSVFASVIHSTYSFLQEYGKFSNVVFAALFFESAFFRTSGTTSSFFGGAGFFATLIPFSFSSIAWRIRPSITLSDGRSFSEVILPKLPIAVLFFGNASVSIKDCFQNPKVQCCLNAANPHSSPLYSKLGMLHLSVSVTSGQPLWISSLKWFITGRANSADFSI